jgi:hypothetical protein
VIADGDRLVMEQETDLRSFLKVRQLIGEVNEPGSALPGLCTVMLLRFQP